MRGNGICMAVLMASVAVSGCATTQGMSTGSISPIKAQADDFKVTVAQGAAVGALVGGLAGALTGNGDSKRILQGALIGGAAGAVGGYLIAGQKQSYASREDALDAVADDSRQRNQKLTGILSTTNQVIAQRRSELDRLKASTATAQEKQSAQKVLLSNLEGDKAALDQAIESARSHGQQIDANVSELKRQFPDDRSAGSLDAVAGEFQRNENSLEQKPAEIFQMINETSQIRVAA
jgi:gas vesicle protein